MVGPFKKYSHYISAVFSLIVLAGVSMFFYYSFIAKAATYNFVQTSWQASTTSTAAHATDQSGWTNFYSKSSGMATGTELSLSITGGSDTIDFTTEGNYVQEDSDYINIANGKTNLQSNNIYGSDVCTGGTVYSTYQGSEAASTNRFKAFDDITTNYWDAVNNLPNWITYDLGDGNDKTVAKFTLETSAAFNHPTAWEFLGSSNNSDWTEINSYSGESFSSGEKRSFTFSNSTSYRYYRLNFTAVNVYSRIFMEEIEMMELEGVGYSTTPYYVTTADASQLDTSSWGTIEGVSITASSSAQTDIKYYVSFDDRANWNYWSGSAWISTTTLANMQTYGMSATSTLETLTSANWSASGGFTSGSTTVMDFAMDLSTSDSAWTPELDQISVDCSSSQDLVSSQYDSGDPTNVMGGINWTQDSTLPAGTTVTMYLRASSSAANLLTTDWSEVASSTASFLTSGCSDASGVITCTNAVIPAAMKDGTGDQWMQYKVQLDTTSANTPTISDITPVYVVNVPPDFETTATATHGSDGLVTITYSVRDTDTASGTVTPNEVTPSFEYSLNNGSTWNDITTGLSSSATSTKSVQAGSYTEYAPTWNAVTEIPSQYTTTAKIRVTVNDSEGANNTASSTSAAFTLDTTDPIPTSFSIIATTTPATLKLDASDDSTVQMKISLNSDLDGASFVSFASTTTISLGEDPDIVYYQIKDAYGNTTSIVSSTTPGTPTSPMVQDVSNINTDPDEEAMFVAWKAVSEPTPGFDQYEIYRSTDNSTYTLLGTESTRTTNYYYDSTVSADTTYYYKVATKDSGNSLSYLSTAVYGTANGIQDSGEGGGGTDGTAATISNVATSSIYTTQATVTWDTSELADSAVTYITSTGGDFSAAPITGLSTMLDDSSGVGQHSITLTGLTAGTDYYFQVRSIDPSSNIATSTSGVDGYMFTTLSGPAISNITAESIDNTEATISWDTDSSANSYVVYSTSSDLSGSTETGTADTSTAHSVDLTGLTAGTRYYYYVKSGVTRDNNAGDYYTFNTTQDSVDPTISSVSVDAAKTTATIKWVTTELATSTVNYGTTDSYGSASTSDTYTIQHAVTLTGLTANTEYNYQISSADANGNTVTGTNRTFTTLTASTIEYVGGGARACPVGDNSEPTIREVSYVIKSTEAVISWVTNESSDSIVDYGSNDEYGLIEGNEHVSLVEHQVRLVGLTPGATYHFRVSSADSSGNRAIGDDIFFTTFTADGEIAAIIVPDEDLDSQTGDTDSVIDKVVTADENLLKTTVAKAAEIITRVASKVSVQELKSNLISSINTIEEVASYIPAPILGGEPIVETNSNKATISWTTDEPANSLIDWVPEDDFDSEKENPYLVQVGNAYELTTDHEVQIINLFPSTSYRFRLISKGRVGPAAQSKDFVFETKSERPEVLNWSIKDINPHGATFTWQTNVETDSVVKYTPYRRGILSFKETKTQGDPDKGFIHEIELDNLESGVNYSVELQGRTSEGILVTKSVGRFNTTEDVVPPEISRVRSDSAISVKGDKIQTIITWFTNEPSMSQVFYQEGIKKDIQLIKSTFLDKQLVTKHVVVITDFQPATVHRFFIESQDAQGNKAISRDFTILTPQQKKTVVKIIIDNFEQTFGWVGRLRL